MCGNVKIPFPFGLTYGCYLNKKFYITCEDNVTAQTGDFTVKNISIEDHELRVLQFVAQQCYNQTGALVEGIKSWLKTSSYTISKFIALAATYKEENCQRNMLEIESQP
ncbi:hypothetical protein ACJW31_12G113200 [Castanea mollissima]